MIKNYNALAAALTKKKVPCRLKLYTFCERQRISIELGHDFPNCISNKVFDVVESIGLNPNSNEISVCAESCGGVTIMEARITGGPKRY